MSSDKLSELNKKSLDEYFLDYKLEKEPDKFALLPKALELTDIIFDNDLDKILNYLLHNNKYLIGSYLLSH